MWLDRWKVLIALTLSLTTSPAWSADAKTLKRLVTPAPAALVAFAPHEKPRALKFARLVIQLKPEPWAVVSIGSHWEGDYATSSAETLLTWQEGRIDLKPSIVSGIVADELRAAGGTTDDAQSLFAENAGADLLLGARVTEMTANFCQYCDRFMLATTNWVGAVAMSTRWEVYSALDRRVVATIETRGGFTTPKGGIQGDPERLIYEAFRDNVRRLIADPDFRRTVTSDLASSAGSSSALQPIKLIGAPPRRSIAEATQSVVTIFSGVGAGSGLLVSTEGYILTNQHVVGDSKFVKVKWSDGVETLGEVVRADRRRDVALIKVSPPKRSPLALRHTGPQVGEAVFAVGTPLDEKFEGSVTKGVVSAMRNYEGLTYIQSDVVVNHGNSGGPLLDEKGAVIGITVSGMDVGGAPAGINLFIPIDDALKALALSPAT